MRIFTTPAIRRYATSEVVGKRVKSLEHLPPLPRPLGVRKRPNLDPEKDDFRSITEDNEKRLAQKKVLEKEFMRSYYQGVVDTRFLEGKTWLAPESCIREDKALYFPNISGKSLDTGAVKHTTVLCYGKISVISILNTKMSEHHCSTFTKATHEAHSSHPLYQAININLQESMLKSLIVSLFVRGLRSSVPPQLHPTYLLSSQNMMYVREDLGYVNDRIGYVYLVDDNLKIRWAGGSTATPGEVDSLKRCTRALLTRLEKKRYIPRYPPAPSPRNPS